MSTNYAPIGILKTCFPEKFGVPRQSMMVTEARGIIKLNSDPAYRAAVDQLERFSHIWIIFVFHKIGERAWRPMIKSPRIEASKVGVFASRSPHRPNPIGMSAVKLERIDLEAQGGIEIHVSGVDILDGTPVLDIKPYLPYADIIPEANSGWADREIERYSVEFSSESLAAIESSNHAGLKELLLQMIALDPRPTAQRDSLPIDAEKTKGMNFGFRVLDLEVEWEFRGGGIFVLDIVPTKR